MGLTEGAASFASCAKGADLDPSDMTETSTHVFKRDVRKCRVPHPLRCVQRVRVLILTIRRRIRRKFLSGMLAGAHAYDAAMSTAKRKFNPPDPS